MLDVKSKRKAKLAALAEQIATARSIVEAQQALLEKLRLSGQPTLEAEAVFAALAKRVKAFEMTAEPTRRQNNTLRGLDTLPLRLLAA